MLIDDFKVTCCHIIINNVGISMSNIYIYIYLEFSMALCAYIESNRHTDTHASHIHMHHIFINARFFIPRGNWIKESDQYYFVLCVPIHWLGPADYNEGDKRSNWWLWICIPSLFVSKMPNLGKLTFLKIRPDKHYLDISMNNDLIVLCKTPTNLTCKRGNYRL